MLLEALRVITLALVRFVLALHDRPLRRLVWSFANISTTDLQTVYIFNVIKTC